jgi:hypothetical protein
MVIACTNLISRIFENERIKLDMKKSNYYGIYWPKVLIDEAQSVKKGHKVIGSEIVSYAIISIFYLGVLTKIMWLFFG